MKKPEIAKRMARRSKSSVGEAADRLDRMVQRIVSGLRQGKPANLPGLGQFSADEGGRVTFRPEGEGHDK